MSIRHDTIIRRKRICNRKPLITYKNEIDFEAVSRDNFDYIILIICISFLKIISRLLILLLIVLDMANQM